MSVPDLILHRGLLTTPDRSTGISAPKLLPEPGTTRPCERMLWQVEADRAPGTARRFIRTASALPACTRIVHTKVQLSSQFHGLYSRLFAIAG
ncbi:hypothetical protein ACVWW1_000263 [Bradyrhizobium sp. JR3.5]